MVRIAGAVLGVAVAAAAWLFLAPAQLGGSTGYVVLYGTSMEPRYSAGDLVLTRPAANVQVGDVVAYHHPELGRTVLHRVVEQQGERLQLKGDANDYLDLPRATKVAVVGREWLHLPGVGGALERVRQPVPAGAIALLCVLLFAGVGASAARRRDGSPQPQRPQTPPAPASAEAEAAKARRALEAMAVVGGVVVLGILLGLVAWTRPTTERVPWPDRWRHEARLSYETPVRASAVYPDGRVDTGETVFARQVPKLRVRLEYAPRTRQADPARLGGTAALEARIRGDNGWHRTLPLAATRVSSGATALEGVLDLRLLETMAGRVESLTGTRATAYDVTLAAAVDVDGDVAGDAVRHRFAPTFGFRLHDGRLEPIAAEADAAGAPATWTRTEPGEGTRVAPARVAYGPAVVEVGDLRLAAVALGLLALVGVPFGLLYVLWPRSGDGADPIEPWLVDVARIPAAREVRDVPSPEALLRVAARYETVVLRVQRPGGRLLGVEVGGILYRHLVGEVEDWPDEPRQPRVTYLTERTAR
jgi:signal peptidase I